LTLHIGIDPGVSGAIAFLPEGRDAFVLDLPTFIYGKRQAFVKRALDTAALAQLLRVNTTGFDLVAARVYIERVNAFPGQGASSGFSLGMSYWGAVGVAHGVGLEVQYIEPEAWKPFFKLGKDKGDSLDVARKLFPAAAESLKRVKDHNRAEALLIAAYGRQKTEKS
jgi:crossover junction endodeoxyribonuclease RuvC